MNEELKVKITAEASGIKKGVEEAKTAVKTFKERVEDAKKDVDSSFKAMGENIKSTAKTITGTLAGIGIALIGTAAGTEEYRNQQAQLKTAFESAGASAETATKTYNDLYRVLGDTGQAQEAAQHLALLTNDQQALSEWTTITQGIYATFGASLPVESLTEAANETA